VFVQMSVPSIHTSTTTEVHCASCACNSNHKMAAETGA